jgi:hypothetical protein
MEDRIRQLCLALPDAKDSEVEAIRAELRTAIQEYILNRQQTDRAATANN